MNKFLTQQRVGDGPGEIGTVRRGGNKGVTDKVGEGRRVTSSSGTAVWIAGLGVSEGQQCSARRPLMAWPIFS